MPVMVKRKQIVLLAACLFWLSGCASFAVNSVVRSSAENLQRQTDMELVCDGAPAFLLMIDSMLAADPHNQDLLVTTTKAYGGYVAALVSCGRKERAASLSVKARDYGQALLDSLMVQGDDQLENFQISLQKVSAANVGELFWAGYGWAVWLQHQEGAPGALADLVKVEQIMLRVLALDENYFHGGAHLFLGAYYGGRPQMLGGNPSLSLSHFEKALAISERRFLPIQVAFAETYARTVFDRKLYIGLLQEVLDFPLKSRPELALANQAAKSRARQLFDEADLYF